MDKALVDSLILRASDIGLKILGALAVWIIGRRVIHFVLNLLVSRLEKRKFDHTIIAYARNTASVALNIALAVVMLGMLGIETTSFAAVLAAAGFAIGAAWSGLLGNLAAGAFLVILRPFKAGDTIAAGGVIGKVVEVGLFATTLNTLDNVRTTVGNSKLLGDNVRNFSANAVRRLEMSGTVARSANVEKTMDEIRTRLIAIPNVVVDPAPEISILAFDEHGMTLAIRPYTHNDNYWQVYFDATAALRDLLSSAGLGSSGGHSSGGEGELPEGAEPEEAEEGEREAGEHGAESGEEAAKEAGHEAAEKASEAAEE